MATCKRCNNNNVTWLRARGGGYYLVDGAGDDTRAFHSKTCGKTPQQAAVQHKPVGVDRNVTQNQAADLFRKMLNKEPIQQTPAAPKPQPVPVPTENAARWVKPATEALINTIEKCEGMNTCGNCGLCVDCKPEHVCQTPTLPATAELIATLYVAAQSGDLEAAAKLQALFSQPKQEIQPAPKPVIPPFVPAVALIGYEFRQE